MPGLPARSSPALQVTLACLRRSVDELYIAANAYSRSMNFDFETLVHSNRLILVDFHAPWCGPCRAMMPMLDEVQAELGDLLHLEKINVDEQTPLAVQQRVMGVPTLILFRQGKELWRHAGDISKAALLQAIREAQQATA